MACAFLTTVCVNLAAAQCSSCGTAAVSTFAPAYTTSYAPAPVVWQTNRPTTGWYPGALIDRWRINRWERWNGGTVVTAGYAPTYTAAYTPTFPPSYYATSFRPVTPIVQTVGFAPTIVASSCSTCCSDPCSCSRAVVMRPICDSCSSCSGCSTGCASCSSGCSSCGGSSFVGQAVYESSGSTSCAGCATSQASTYVSPSYNSTPATTNGQTPQPTVAPNENVPEQRTTERPEEKSVVPNGEQPTPAAEEDGSEPSTLFQAPDLFNPSDRVTSNTPNVPVWTAVYHSSNASARPTSRQVSSPQGKQPTAAEVARDAEGWTSAGK